ncbi:hypothetical protein BD770DRAFT_471558 [Pilaira anomala]|nr:hypothetical protein BD770DRAFT_471558 [Pilaira anomala]
MNPKCATSLLDKISIALRPAIMTPDEEDALEYGFTRQVNLYCSLCKGERMFVGCAAHKYDRRGVDTLVSVYYKCHECSNMYNGAGLTKSEVAVNSIKSDMRRMEEKLDNLTFMLQKIIDEQSSANNTTGIEQSSANNTTGIEQSSANNATDPHRALNHPDIPSLLLPNDRTIPKPRQKEKRYRKVAYIEDFIFQTRADLRIKPDDNASERNRKKNMCQEIVLKLNSYTRIITIQLIAKIKALNLSEDTCNWKNIPDYLKAECYRSLELLAKRSNIDLDRCIDSWAANILVRSRYPNATRIKTNNVDDDDQEAHASSVDSNSVDDNDNNSHFGTDDEEPTIITVKRENKPPNK